MTDAAATPKLTKLIKIYADTRGMAKCRGCGAWIEWAEVVKSGRRMCFTGAIVVVARGRHPTSNRVIETADLATNHWADCPDAGKFKRKTK